MLMSAIQRKIDLKMYKIALEKNSIEYIKMKWNQIDESVHSFDTHWSSGI